MVKVNAGQPGDLANLVATAALEHKAQDPVLLNLSGLGAISDWFFIASGQNSRQMEAIADTIVKRARQAGFKPLNAEGLKSDGGNWILIDLGSVIAHIFNPETRARYDLESLWGPAPRPGSRAR